MVRVLVALVAIIDVPGNIPIFVQHTARLSGSQQTVTAVTAALATCAVLLVFASAGEFPASFRDR